MKADQLSTSEKGIYHSLNRKHPSPTNTNKFPPLFKIWVLLLAT